MAASQTGCAWTGRWRTNANPELVDRCSRRGAHGGVARRALGGDATQSPPDQDGVGGSGGPNPRSLITRYQLVRH
jgi:hypothetical protein